MTQSKELLRKKQNWFIGLRSLALVFALEFTAPVNKPRADRETKAKDPRPMKVIESLNH